MIYGSICSGIEAASVAWHPLGWQAAFLSEIDAFPRAVLSHHYPDVPLHGDFTTIREGDYAAIDVLVGGTPCQSFSIAGLRAGLDDERGNLALEFCRLARRLGPKWVVWENVPGVLSLDGGRAFASVLGGLAECGYGLAYRVLDAQFVRVDGFGRAVPQRRRRVFVVGCLGDWRRAAAVLFERASLSGHPAPRRQAGQDVAGTLAARAGGGGWPDGGDGRHDQLVAAEYAATLTRGAESAGKGGYAGRRQEDDINLVAHTLNAKGGAGRSDSESETFLPVAHALRADGFDASEDGAGRGTPLVPVHPYTLAIRGRGESHNLEYRQDGTANAILTPNGGRAGIGVGAVCFDETQITSAANRCNPRPGDPSHPLAAAARPPTLAFHARQDPDHGPVTHPLDTDGSSIGILTAGSNYASPQEADAGALLRGVRDALGEKAFAEWGLGILDTLQPAEILRSALHGSELRPAAFSRRWVVYCALSRAEDRAEGAMRSLREAQGERRASQGREPPEQLIRELGAYLSELSQPGAQPERFMRDLWIASEGLGLLRQALSAVQAARRPTRCEGESALTPWRVRRLMVEECEFLQGFPRGYTAIPYRGKSAADGPRYKALGNSMAVNVMRWIGRRIEMVEKQ